MYQLRMFKYLPCCSQSNSYYEVITVEGDETSGVGCLMLKLRVSHMHFHAIHVAFCITADSVFGERPMLFISFHFHAEFSRSRFDVYRLQNSKSTQLCTKLGRDITWILCFSAEH